MHAHIPPERKMQYQYQHLQALPLYNDNTKDFKIPGMWYELIDILILISSTKFI